ncbi:MAG: histidinol dehydrogenase [Ignavibacteria bacterium]|nr:histidinol dehydrogenase [Ignavibacteria bacterium]
MNTITITEIRENGCRFPRPSEKNTLVKNTVKDILRTVRQEGREAVISFSRRFDMNEREYLRVSDEEFREAEKEISLELKNAIQQAYTNILTYHNRQKPESYTVETMPGVMCQRIFRPLDSVGLYIPGGTAVLPSTVLMLGVPAQIAGCRRIVLCTPAAKNVNPAVLYAASVCGIKEVYTVGGAQAVGMLAYGVEGIPSVEKIFGPGNQFVTEAKIQVSSDPDGCAIDMPAGPSEVMIIADESARANYIAADFLAQLEHGFDSQAILITDSSRIYKEVQIEIERQLQFLPRAEYVRGSLQHSYLVKVDSLNEAVEIANDYAAEHLIIQTTKPEELLDKIYNAGSVFLGDYTPESAGDYASGTNHSLPTSGYAKAFSGVTVEAFGKFMSVQQITREGLSNLEPVISALADAENLFAHKNAVLIRLEGK